jgi:hypothetical protein
MRIPTVVLAAVCSQCLHAQLSLTIPPQPATSTQAVVSYTSPDTRPCRIEVSESPSFVPVVHDVNPAIFPNSDQDLQRATTIAIERRRTVVLGHRTAETGRDGKRYSRALQASTRHYLRITCSGGSIVQTGAFETTTIAVGQTYNEPLPVDPQKPGEYAWPHLDWTDRTRGVVDPKTGLLLRRLTMPADVTSSTGTATPFRDARDLSGVWQDPQSAVANDTLAASATGTGWLFLDAGLAMYLGGTHDVAAGSLDRFTVQLNAWCTDCAGLSADARTLEACLSYDGVQCASKTLSATVEPCAADCTGARYRFELGAAPATQTPVLTAWGLEKGDITDLHRRTGQGVRRGNRIVRTGGNVFCLNWNPGSMLEFNNRSYTIRKIVSEEQIEIEGEFDDAAAEAEERGSWTGSNFGVLLRKKNANAARLHVQSGSTTHAVGGSPDWDASGDGITFTHCAPVTVPGPTGEAGWHCVVGGMFYWIGGETGQANRLGRTYMPSRTGVDGWGFNPGGAFCNTSNGGGPFWDRFDPNSFFCGQIDSTGGVSVIKATYRGANTDIGPQDLYATLRECRSGQPEPCWVFENMTPVSLGKSLSQQLKNRLPSEFALLRGTVVNLVGFQGKRLLFLARSSNASNDTLGIMGTFDTRTNQIAAAVPSWTTWPLRWSVLHGPEPVDDPEWISVPATFFRGPLSGDDFLTGNGPYQSRITSGPLTTTPGPCPARPADSPIPPHEWPTGDLCTEVTVDGEPADPSPAVYRTGTVTSGAAGTLNGTGVNWRPEYNGAQILIDSRWYSFEYFSPTSGRISPAPAAPFTGVPYAMYLEPVNNPKTGNPLHAYLQDAEVRDVFCVTANGSCRYLFLSNEIVRLIHKDGRKWTLQRGYRVLPEDAGPHAFLPSPANSLLVAVPGGCLLGPIYPCASASVVWNSAHDPEGRNPGGTTLVVDRNAKGGGHGTIGAGATISAVPDECPRVDGQDLTCYAVRPGETFGDRFSADTFPVSNNPPFEGRVGIGTPNDVDSHPSARQDREAAAPEDRIWFGDARPFLGSSLTTGSAANPGIEIEEGLWKFTPNQLRRLRPKHMPTLAACGSNPLVDVSGPGSRIARPEQGGAYTYCISGQAGECRQGSEPGELFVSCPYISRPHCHYAGVGNPGTEIRDICVMDNGAYTSGITQIRHTEPDLEGAWGRLLTHGLSLYRWNDLFWNPKTTPDGKWLLFRTQWVNGKRSDAFLVKLPPFQPLDEQKRNGYLMREIQVPAGRAAVAVEFGYNPAFACTSRRESCIATVAASDPFAYSVTENWAPVPCKDGCTLQIPVIAQRVLFYRLRYFDADGKPAGESGAAAVAVP